MLLLDDDFVEAGGKLGILSGKGIYTKKGRQMATFFMLFRWTVKPYIKRLILGNYPARGVHLSLGNFDEGE